MNCRTVKPEQSPEEIQNIINGLAPGDCCRFAKGTYRMALKVNLQGTAEAPIRLEAEEPGQVILTGADIVRDWQADGDLWKTHIDLSHLAPSPQHGALAGRREQVFIDGAPLKQVLEKSRLTPGHFHYDDNSHELTIYPQVFCGEQRGGQLEMDKGAIQGGGTKKIQRSEPLHRWPFLLKPFEPKDHTIEVTTRCNLLELTGTGSARTAQFEGCEHLGIRGLKLRASGDAPQKPMFMCIGRHLIIEDCQFEHGAARGFDIRAHHTTFRNCSARLNGQLGFAGFGTDNLIEDCQLHYNNTKHDDFVCFEQGGCKIVRTNNFVLRRIQAIANDGPGLWYDIDNTNAVIEQCLCESNSGPGIMYEISETAKIRNNLILRNGFSPKKDVTWNSRNDSVRSEEPVYGQGILVQMSKHCEVYNNTCVGNRRVGIELRHHPYQQAGNPGHATERYKLINNRVFNNLLADNGWTNLDESIPPRNPAKADEVANNSYDYNLYHNRTALQAHEGNLLSYARWGKTMAYGVMSLEEWRASRDQDMHSIQWDPCFIAPENGDFRLEAHSVARGHGKTVPELKEDYHGKPRAPEHPVIGACV